MPSMIAPNCTAEEVRLIVDEVNVPSQVGVVKVPLAKKPYMIDL